MERKAREERDRAQREDAERRRREEEERQRQKRLAEEEAERLLKNLHKVEEEEKMRIRMREEAERERLRLLALQKKTVITTTEKFSTPDDDIEHCAFGDIDLMGLSEAELDAQCDELFRE